MKAKTAQEIWETALGQLQLQVSKANYRTWLEKSRGLSYQNNHLVLGVPNTFVAEYLDKNLRSLIEKTLIGIIQREVNVNFSVDNQNIVVDPGHAIAVSPAPMSMFPVRAACQRLNPKYTFDSFIVSGCNRLAHAAASGVADQPGLSSYNPLYIYGGVGLGKTHLLNAIGNSALNRGMKVVYVSAEQFTTDFVNSVRERKTNDFRDKYRNTDMLLIDDIQFISGKEQTEESFFHIFNDLRDTDRQIALTSNCPPHSIPLIEERLRSRLEWGLSAGIHPPDFDTRLKILSSKARKEGVNLTPDVLEYIAEHIKQNIRELEGSLNRVVAYAKLLRAVVTPELASEALEDIATKKAKAPPAPAILLETVAEYFNLEVLDLKSTKRDRQTALARQITMYLLRENTDYSLSRIGLELGGRQPILVSQACKKISAGILENQELKQTVSDIQGRIDLK
ncbi:MAG: chromosomal replication initiator protein DnaA [Dehalococcoidales bacterium]|nr:chromosomal replication initiator protein DnaA [Dehalococcoidales bacterium]